MVLCDETEILVLGRRLVHVATTSRPPDASVGPEQTAEIHAVSAEMAAGPQTVDGVAYTTTRYESLAGASPGTVLFVEDYPQGSTAHGKTLAVGVMRWVRFVAKGADLKVERYDSAAERDQALTKALPAPNDGAGCSIL